MTDNIYIMGDEDRRRFAKIVASAWSDDSFAQRYINAPHVVLREYGIEYPAHVQAPALPVKPEGELALDALELVAGDAAGIACASSVSSVVTSATFLCPDGIPL